MCSVYIGIDGGFYKLFKRFFVIVEFIVVFDKVLLFILGFFSGSFCKGILEE